MEATYDTLLNEQQKALNEMQAFYASYSHIITRYDELKYRYQQATNRKNKQYIENIKTKSNGRI